MDASMNCSIGRFAPGECGISSYFPHENSTLQLYECTRDVTQHLQDVKLCSGVQTKFKAEVECEGHLIALRAGLFSHFSFQKTMTVCPKHRYALGIRWRSRKRCCYPEHRGSCKPQLALTTIISRNIFHATGALYPIGSGICKICWKSCREKYGQVIDDNSVPSPVEEGNDTSAASVYNFRDKQQVSTYMTDNFMDGELLSQETPSQNSQCSNWSDDYASSKDDSLPQLNATIATLGNGSISPIRFQLRTPLEKAAESTKRYLKRKAEETMNLVLEKIAPGQKENLLQLILSEQEPRCHDQQLLDTFIKIYLDVSDNQIKSQILSLISSKMSKSELMEKIPGLTKYKVDQARLHAARYGPGNLPKTEMAEYRQRMDPVKMEHALNFFSSPNFVSSVSFGTRKLHLDSGEEISIPDVVRTVCHNTLVDMYTKYCQEEEFIPLGRSSLFKVLNACAASKRVSLRGLDNIATDGACAFDDLITICEKLCDKGLPLPVSKQLKADIVASKRYMKTDYKIEIQKENVCADHCCQFGLSDPSSPYFQTSCNRLEDHLQCDNCNAVSIVTAQIKNSINEVCSEDEREELVKEVEDATIKILEWKAHILRAIHQDSCRTDTLNSLQTNQALIVMDWAMKYLPNFHREKQSDWFAQKGMNWHACVCICKEPDGSLKHRTYTHIMQSCKQDWFAVASILEHTLITTKKQLPHINQVFLRSDNAGCYHCANLWLSIPGISERSGVEILELGYSEASSGKSYCDAKFAHMRGKMRSFVASGKNIIEAHDMKDAIDSGKGVVGCQVAVIDIDTTKQGLFSHLWKNVSSITNLKFSSDGVVVHKAYGIGDGQFLSTDILEKFAKNKTQGECLPLVVCDFVTPDKSEGSIKSTRKEYSNNSGLPRENVSLGQDCDVESCADVDADVTIQSAVFYCPEPGCLKVYQKHSSLNDHLLTEKHNFIKTQNSSFDKIKQHWAETCNSVKNSTNQNFQQNSEGKEKSKLHMGWALKKERKAKRFSCGVKEYLKSVFEDGERSGKKSNPAELARRIKTIRDTDGHRKFQPSEWLQPSQIASYFCRLAVLYRTGAKVTVKTDDVCSGHLEDEDLMAIFSHLDEGDVRQEIIGNN